MDQIDNDSSFFHHFFSSLLDHSETTLIIGGDFNLVLNLEIDRFSESKEVPDCRHS